MYKMAHNASQDALAAIGKIEQHEAVCSERWGHTKESMGKLEHLPVKVAELHGSVGATGEKIAKLENLPEQITSITGDLDTLKRAVGWGATATIVGIAAVAWFFFTNFVSQMQATLQAVTKAAGAP